MSTVYEIPTSPEAQNFSISLAGVSYQMGLLWSTAMSLWLISIADANEAPILTDIPMVANTDLLAPYPYLNFGGQLIAQTDNSPETPPTYDNLGITGHLYFVTP